MRMARRLPTYVLLVAVAKLGLQGIVPRPLDEATLGPEICPLDSILAATATCLA
jgi:hypothetical protein